MTKLLQSMLDDPDAVFEITADLPSGNRMTGTVGPMIGANLVVSVTFSKFPVSDEDVRIARYALDQALGKEPVVVAVSNSAEEHVQAIKKARLFMGGGEG